MTNPPHSADYDNPWKEAIEAYFPAFLAFFFPQVRSLIDWTREPISLDQELQQIAPDAELGTRFADKLFQVWQRDGGEETWILVHIEVQSQVQPNFAERMYIYNYRAYDRHRKPVISLAILGDERPQWRPSEFGYRLGGCEVKLIFPIAKLLDYQTQLSTLTANPNPFAVLVTAHLQTLATNRQPEARQTSKWQLVRSLYERGYDREDIQKLFRLIDWMMTLPEELQHRFERQVVEYEEDRRMPILSRMELRGLERGNVQMAQENILEILEVRFGEVSASIRETIASIRDIPRLKQLLREAIAIPSLADFETLLEP
jgi:hypothetical protein